MYVDLLCRKCIRDDDDVLFDNISRLNNQCVGFGYKAHACRFVYCHFAYVSRILKPCVCRIYVC